MEKQVRVRLGTQRPILPITHCVPHSVFITELNDRPISNRSRKTFIDSRAALKTCSASYASNAKPSVSTSAV
jgi:hypothetical protein